MCERYCITKDQANWTGLQIVVKLECVTNEVEALENYFLSLFKGNDLSAIYQPS